MGVVSDPFWVNRASGISDRNGTTTHTINFGFTSTAGNVLLVIVSGAVTHTNAGWTERLSPVNSGETSVFTKTSTGDSSFVDTTNGSNYPVVWAVYELPAGTSWVNGAQANQTGAAKPTILTVESLPGTEVVTFAARGINDSYTGITPVTASMAWPESWVEDVDLHAYRDQTLPTDGGHLSVARQINYTGTTSPGGTVTPTNEPTTNDAQWVAFALDVPALGITYVGGSDSGDAVSVTSRATNVVAGIADGDIAVIALEQWGAGANPGTITPPSGFTQKGGAWSSGSGDAVNTTWWKRLDGSESGTWNFSWTGGSFWTTVQAQVFRGCVASGDPFDGAAVTAVGSWGSIPTQNKSLSNAGGALVWAVYNDTGGTHIPPTDFTETADVDCASMAYRIPGTAGVQAAAGASISTSSAAGIWYGALVPGSTVTPPPEQTRNQHAMAQMMRTV